MALVLGNTWPSMPCITRDIQIYQIDSNITVISIGFIFQVRCECAVLTVIAGKDWCSTWDGNKYDLVFYGVSGYTGYLMMERS